MQQDFNYLTKKEKKQLRRNEREEVEKREKRNKMIRNCFIVSLLILLIGGSGWWVIKESNKPLPGVAVEDLGRQHIPRAEWEKYKYNSNPPTSGSHDAEWIKAGVYDSPQGDGYLIHSLEHGYVVISYNCERVKSKACQDLKKELIDLAKNQKLSKLIVVPRPELDVPIALTAWARILKMDKIDKESMRRFIDSYRDQGPEKTLE
ncbi:MAG: DUF3105 domain-containing protein [Candidatus Levybacteria bacterium]|nr:DUF3105 domain-containing protein [Candidatus Levybacteria bacterium]